MLALLSTRDEARQLPSQASVGGEACRRNLARTPWDLDWMGSPSIIDTPAVPYTCSLCSAGSVQLHELPRFASPTLPAQAFGVALLGAIVGSLQSAGDAGATESRGDSQG